MTLDSGLIIRLLLTTSWGSIHTVCTGIGRVRPLKLKAGDIVPISLKRRDLRMTPDKDAVTAIRIANSEAFTLTHSMKMDEGISLSGWIRVADEVNEEQNNYTVVKADFLHGSFLIPVTKALAPTGQCVPTSSGLVFQLVLTPQDWFFQSTHDPKLIKSPLQLKPIPGCSPKKVFCIINTSEVLDEAYELLKKKLSPFGLRISRPNNSPQIGLDLSSKDGPLLVLAKGITVYAEQKETGWVPHSMQINLIDGVVELQPKTPVQRKSKISIHSDNTGPSYKVELGDSLLVLEGARGSDFQFAHSSWLWSYSKVSEFSREYSTWLRWAIPSADSKAKVIPNANNRLRLNCRLLFPSGSRAVSITSCSINPLSGVFITLDDGKIEITASDLDIEISVKGFDFLPSVGQTSNPASASDGTRHLASPEAAPALLEPSDHVKPASLIFRLAPATSANLIRLESSLGNSQFDSETSNFSIRGPLHVLDYISPTDALLTLPSVSAYNSLETLPNTATWDSNQGQALKEVSLLKFKVNKLMPVDLDGGNTNECKAYPFAIRTMLPWVEWQGPTQSILYHRNLVCGFDEWMTGGVDSSLSTSGEGSQNGIHTLSLIHDLYARAAVIAKGGGPLERDTWWPGLKFMPEFATPVVDSITISNEPYDCLPILPCLRWGKCTLSLQPQSPEHPWLDASVTKFSDTYGDDYGGTATIASMYSDNKICLTTDLLVNQSFFLDQGGFLRKAPVAGGRDHLLFQPLIVYSPPNTAKSLVRVSGARHFSANNMAVNITVSFFDLLLEVKPEPAAGTGNVLYLPAHTDGNNSHVLTLTTGNIFLSGSGIYGCPVEFKKLISLAIVEDTPDSVYGRISFICFEGVITLLRSSGDDGEHFRVDVEAQFTLDDNTIQIKPLSSPETPTDCIHIAIPSSHVSRFPHSSVASPITHICGSLELANDKLVLKINNAFVDFLDSQRGITHFPDLYTVDGLQWVSFPTTTRAESDLDLEPIWSWPNGSQATQNGEHQGSWHPIPFRCIPPAQPTEYQASLAGMLWSNPQKGHFRFYRFLDPENPVVYDVDDLSSTLVVAWDLLSTDCLRSCAEDGHLRLLAVITTGSEPGYCLKVSDEQGHLWTVSEHNQDVGRNFKPIIRWIDSSRLLVVIDANTLIIYSFDQTRASPERCDLTNSLDCNSLINVLPIYADSAGQFLYLAAICSNKIVVIKCQSSRVTDTLCVQIANERGRTINKALALSDRLAVRVEGEGWYLYRFCDLVSANSNELNLQLPESDAIETIAEHSGLLYAAKRISDQTSAILRFDPSPDRQVGRDQWQTLTNLPALIENSLSTPLGPWWFANNNQDVFGMDGVVEWDAKGLRAQLAFECPINPASAATTASTTGSEQGAKPTLHWRTTWGASAWLQLSYTEENEAIDPDPATQSSQQRQLALARDVQEGQIVFTIPDFQPPSQLRLQKTDWIWRSGALLIWNEPGSDSRSVGLGGALLSEGVCPWKILNVSIKGFPEPDSTSSTLAHCLNIGWSHQGKWQTDRRVTAALHRKDGWTLQLHEQRLNAQNPTSCMGLLAYAESNGADQCQMPVIINTSSPPDDKTRRIIQAGLYRFSPHSVNKTGQLDLCLHGADCANTSITLDCYDIEPLLNPDANRDESWVLLSSEDDGKPSLKSIRKEVAPRFLDEGITLAGPKQPIREIQFGHRRIFGARLRFLTESLSVIDSETALMRHQAYTYYKSHGQTEDLNDEDNPYSGLQVIKLLHHDKPDLSAESAAWNTFSEYWIGAAQSPNNGRQAWNSGCSDPGSDKKERGWREIEEDTAKNLMKGDCIITWQNDVPLAEREIAFKPPDEDPAFSLSSGTSMWVGALLAQMDNKIVLISEPFWQNKRNESDPPVSWRSENLLIMGRSPAALEPTGQSVPVISCLRSVTDVVQGDTNLRALSDDEARTWLLAHGSQGFALRRVCTDQGPSRYEFLRSPFVQAGQEQEIDSTSTSEHAPASDQPADQPITPTAQPQPPRASSQFTNPRPTHVPFYYHPADITNDSEYAPVPVFRSPQRRVRLNLNAPTSEYEGPGRSQNKTTINTLLLHEAVAYPNRIQNRTPVITNQLQTPAVESEEHSFLPECIDFAYGTDKPGGMVVHTVTPLFSSKPADATTPPPPLATTGGHALGEWGQGPLTEFLMRDPLRYHPPENSAIEVRSCKISKDNGRDLYRAHLLFDDVLGTVDQPAPIPLFDRQAQPEAPSNPPFIFKPEAIRILSRAGDQLFVVDQDSDFIPCDENRQIYILYCQSNKNYLTSVQQPSGSEHSFILKGFELDNSVTTALHESGQFCLSAFKQSAITSGPNDSLSIFWEVRSGSPGPDNPRFFCYFQQDYLSQDKIKSLPLRVMPTLASPKVAVVLQKYQGAGGDPPTVRRESTELFGSVSSSRLSFSAPNNGSQKLHIFCQHSVTWELRDADWVINPGETTGVTVVKYLPDGATFAASKAIEMPQVNS